MNSSLHKVLHPLAGRPMLLHLLAAVEALGATRTVVVVGAQRAQVEAAVGTRAAVVIQEPQLGTGHAVSRRKARSPGSTARCWCSTATCRWSKPRPWRECSMR